MFPYLLNVKNVDMNGMEFQQICFQVMDAENAERKKLMKGLLRGSNHKGWKTIHKRLIKEKS